MKKRIASKSQEEDNRYYGIARWINSRSWAKRAAKCLSVSSVTIFLVTILVVMPRSLANIDDFGTYDIIFGVLFAGSAFITYVLSALYKDSYWFSVDLGIQKLDERQLAVRRRITERSYQISAVLTLLAILFVVPLYKDALQTLINSGQIIIWPMVFVSFFLYSLPSIIAAWQKDA